MRKRSFLLLLCVFALLVGLAGAAAAETTPKDIAPDHPAYKAVVGLVEKGYLGLYQDGTFQGTHPADRYTLASVVGKILADIQSGKLTLPAEEMKTLRQLATEFRAELVELAGRVNAQGQAQEKISSDVAILREDGTRVLGEIYQMQSHLTQVDADLGKLNGDLTKLASEFETVRVETAKAHERTTAVEGRLAADDQATAEQDSRLAALESKLSGDVLGQLTAGATKDRALESAQAELRAEFDSYRRSTEAEVAHLKTMNRWLVGGLAVLGLLAVSR